MFHASSGLLDHQPIPFAEVKEQAFQLGWDDVGITTATISDEDIQAYKDWLAGNGHADLKYMENDLRCYPQKLFPGAKTAIIFVSNYKQPRQPFRPDAGLIASYARGKKYHNVHHKRLKKFIHWLEKRSGKKNVAKGFSDSTPILEKALAVQAGLGWFGKNTLLIHRRFGTFTLLSGVLSTLDFTDVVVSKRLPRCGSCQRCIDACPTNALQAPYLLDASKCLSYHLIESKKEIPQLIRDKNPGYIFGCDICQDVCPHNVRSALSQHAEFAPESGMGVYLTLLDVDELKKEPEKLYGTPLQRKGAEGLNETAADLETRRRGEKFS